MMSPAMLRILVAVLASCTVASEPLDRVEAVGEAECEAASLNLLQNNAQALNLAALQPNASELPVTNEIVQLETNATVAADVTGTGLFAEVLAKQMQYELNMSSERTGEKNKIILVVLELLGLGLCGIDRCYMGQTCLGVAKGLTFGGLTVWALLDYVGVIVTCLAMHPSIHFLGMRANFTQGSITAAFVIVIVLLVLKCCSSLWARRLRGNAPSRASAGRSEAK
uniref:TM2 domain-containing protein n=1 Tax=Alexandrium monilatum TaxID=311494 RepID=A0A7S4RW27_9DINO